jgi:hypothetical protein
MWGLLEAIERTTETTYMTITNRVARWCNATNNATHHEENHSSHQVERESRTNVTIIRV